MRRGALAVPLMAALMACATTTVDPSLAAPTGPTTTLAPVSRDASLPELVRDLADAMRHLDEQVIEGDTDEATLARIEEIWLVAAPLAAARSTELASGLEQSIELARSAVSRRRPADASKGYKIVADVLRTIS